MADSFGLKIGVEGEKEFKRALSEINSSMKVLGSEMELVASEFDKTDRSEQALTKRNEVLQRLSKSRKESRLLQRHCRMHPLLLVKMISEHKTGKHN